VKTQNKINSNQKTV